MIRRTLLPNGWAEATFTDALEIIRGVSFPTDAKSFTPAQGHVGCLRTTNVQRTVEWDDLWYVPEKYVRNPRQFVQNEDILISTANSLELVGKVARVSDVKTKATIGTFIMLLRPNANLNPRFIFHQLASLEFQQKIRDTASTTTNISNVSGQKLSALSVFFAPRPEQDRIVEELEKQFTRLDAAVAALKRLQANLKRYRASVLKAACEGRLVPTEAELARREGRSYEPASVLLDRIQVKSNQSSNHVIGLPDLPEGWSWTTLALLIAEGPQNGLYLPKTKYGSGTPILRIDDFQSHMSRASEELRLVNANKEEVALYSLRPGDMVVNRVNSPSHLGKTLFVENRNVPALFESNMMRMRLHNSISGEYIAIYLSSTMGRARLTARAKWAVNQASINQQDVGLTPIPLPPAAEQRRIAVEVSRQLSVLDEIQMQLGTNANRADKLRQSVLKRAFEGKLVPQDQNDEPACTLLERVRGQRPTKAGSREVLQNA